MDIEWALEGSTNILYIVQARPETVQSRKPKIHNKLTTFRLTPSLKYNMTILTKGSSVGSSIGQGKARVITDMHKMNEFRKGEVLVTHKTDPE